MVIWFSGLQGFHHPQGTLTIYAKDYGNQLPSLLRPENDTDFQTDYFDKDKIRLTPSHPHYKAALLAFKKQEESEARRLAKRKLRRGF